MRHDYFAENGRNSLQSLQTERHLCIYNGHKSMQNKDKAHHLCAEIKEKLKKMQKSPSLSLFVTYFFVHIKL